jgi:thioesterase domain-containing protein/acyl carrier protein
LAEIWADLLAHPEIGIHDNFFALGGHSLMTTRLMARIRSSFGLSLPLAAIFAAPTIAQLASLIEERQSEAALPTVHPVGPHVPDGNLIALQSLGEKTPMFWVHPAGGHVFRYMPLARALGPDQPFYAFAASGLEGETSPRTDIEDMVQVYLEQLMAARPQGPLRLGGWSMGGAVALEMARRLHELGRTVRDVTLVDAYAGQPYGRLMTREQILYEFAADLSLPLSLQELENRKQDQVLALLAARLSEQATAAGLDSSRLETLFQVHRANALALAAWEPKPYPAKVTLYHIPGYDAEALAVWKALAGNLRTVAIEGDHTSIVSSSRLVTLLAGDEHP